jgi:hypothetical protein
MTLQELDHFLSWFKFKYEQEKVDPLDLAKTFSSVSEFFTLKSDQLSSIVDLIDGILSIISKLICLYYRSLMEGGSLYWRSC